MVLLATPDFGVGATIAAFGLLAWLFTFLVGCVGVWWGSRYWRTESSSQRMLGLILMLLFASMPVAAYVLPPFYVRATYGNFPVEMDYAFLKDGTSQDEVQQHFGTPHERWSDDQGERWYYWGDWWVPIGGVPGSIRTVG